MANGDAAAEAGMDVVASTAKSRLGYDEINKSRDYIAARMRKPVTPIAEGGTNATTATAAVQNLGLKPTVDKVGAASSTATDGVLLQGGTSGRINVGTPTSASNAATKGYVDEVEDAVQAWVAGDFLRKTGGTVSGGLYLPNASPAATAYVIAYINGDGRISKGASARRFKRRIRRAKLAELGDVFAVKLSEFELKADDTHTQHLGYIADELVGTPLDRFVVRDADGKPEAIDWVELLMTQVAVLHARVVELEAKAAAS